MHLHCGLTQKLDFGRLNVIDISVGKEYNRLQSKCHDYFIIFISRCCVFVCVCLLNISKFIFYLRIVIKKSDVQFVKIEPIHILWVLYTFLYVYYTSKVVILKKS